MFKNSKRGQQQRLQQLKERNVLAHIQRQLAGSRFPRSKVSLVNRVDRLEVCTAQTLAVMDRLLEFWTASVCPFQKEHAELSKSDLDASVEARKKQQPTTTTMEPVTTTKPDYGHNHPYL